MLPTYHPLDFRSSKMIDVDLEDAPDYLIIYMYCVCYNGMFMNSISSQAVLITLIALR